jgi:hypothetical protein
MTIEQTRAQLISSIWQAVAQSGVDLSSVPADQQAALVGKIADQMLGTMNDLLDEAQGPQEEEEPVDEFGEQVLWKGRPFLSLVENYTITTERIKIVRGMLSRGVENFELIRVQDIDLSQGVSERMFGVGDIAIRGHDSSDTKIVLRNVPKPEEVYEILRRAWLEARKRHGLQFREYM